MSDSNNANFQSGSKVFSRLFYNIEIKPFTDFSEKNVYHKETDGDCYDVYINNERTFTFRMSDKDITKSVSNIKNQIDETLRKRYLRILAKYKPIGSHEYNRIIIHKNINSNINSKYTHRLIIYNKDTKYKKTIKCNKEDICYLLDTIEEYFQE